jgi:hypothetical protein
VTNGRRGCPGAADDVDDRDEGSRGQPPAATVNGVETDQLKPELSTDSGEFPADSVENPAISWG